MSQINPKQRFLASPNAAKHQEWSRSEISKAAIEATLALMAADLKGPNLAKLEGAASFASLLLDIAEPNIKRKTPDSSTLKYEQPTTTPNA